MIVTAWNNGSHHSSGAGYGIKISLPDRNRSFKREWDYVVLMLEGYASPVKVNINKESFWGESCRELISSEMGKWLRNRKLSPWKKGSPPKLRLDYLDDRIFRLSELN